MRISYWSSDVCSSDLEDTLDQVHGRFARRVVLAHADLGSGQPARDACTAAMLSSKLAWFMAPGGVIASDQELYLPAAESLALPAAVQPGRYRSEEHTSEIQSLMRNSYAVFCLKQKNDKNRQDHTST